MARAEEQSVSSIPGTRFEVDNFKSRPKQSSGASTELRYFVTHAHSDHFRGLTEAFSDGPIHCSELTAEVVHIKTGVPWRMLSPLPMDKPTFLDGVEVILVDANHCPGAVQLLFRLPDGRSFIHTGDMRFHQSLKHNPHLQRFRFCSQLFLDTTYCNQRYSFPSQEESVEYVASQISSAFSLSNSPPLVVVCTYGIGKERILLECSRRTGHKVYVTQHKFRVLEKLGLDVNTFFTTDQHSSPIHVARWGFLGETFPFFQPNFTDIERYRQELGYEDAIGFVPTGWMYEFKKGPFTTRSKHNTVLHLVPYSEHSSYQELREYVGWIRPHQVVPTVGVNPRADNSDLSEKQRARRRMIENFRDLVNETESKREFLAQMGQSSERQAATAAIGSADDAEKQAPELKEQACEMDVVQNHSAHDINAKYEDHIALEECCEKGKPQALQEEQQTKEADVNRLRQLVGKSEMTHEQARGFLRDYNDDVNAAANAYFDGDAGATERKRRAAHLLSEATSARSKQSVQKGSKAQKLTSIALERKSTKDNKQPSLQTFLSRKSKQSASQEHDDVIENVYAPSQEQMHANGEDCGSQPESSPVSEVHRDNCDTDRKSPAAHDVQKDEDYEQKGSQHRMSLTMPHASNGDASEEGKPYVSVEASAFDPLNERYWKRGSAAPYMHLGRSFEEAIATTKRLKLADIFCNCFRALLARATEEEVIRSVYITLGRVADEHEGGELTVGGATVSSCVAEATNSSREQIEGLYNEKGDLGDVAQQLRGKQRLLRKPAPLTISGVFDVMRKISIEQGSGSNNRKRSHVLNLLRAAQGPETNFIVRTLVQNMRLGANRISVLQAFGYATYLHHRFGPRKISTAEESAISKEDWNWAGSSVKRCFSLRPDLTTLLKCLIQGGIEKMLQECTLRPGLPVQPMLGQISRGIGHAVKQFNGAFLAEFKYDGMRAQIHMTQDEMKVFSRKNEDKTGQMPDVVRIAREKLASSVESAVMDTECVAIDRSTGRFKSFQELSTRSRSDIDESEVNVAVAIYVFDMMYLNGESLVDRPLAERRSFAKASLHHAANEMQLAESEEINEDTPQEECEDKVTSLLHSSLSQQGEGLMLKKLNQPGALYEPGRRSESWMKIKKDYVAELREPLDLVVIGGWWGNGRKAGWLSPFLLACYDPEQEEYQSVCRCMSGFTDSFYKEWTSYFLDNCVLNSKPVNYNTNEQPRFWFEPRSVWEIRGADLSVSPMHCAAFGQFHQSRGVALRFPRFIRVRDDKAPEDATPVSEIVRLFSDQQRRVGASIEEKPLAQDAHNGESGSDE